MDVTPMPSHVGTPLLYAGFSVLVIVLLATDFFLLRTKGAHKVSVKEAACWSVVWFIAAAIFGAWFWWFLRGEYGGRVANQKVLEYVTGYLLEKGLAIENVFVWITIFTYFSIPSELQKRVLLWGVVGAITMRAVLIFLGALLIQKFTWIFYIFGLFLVITGVKMFFATGKKQNLNENVLLLWLRKRIPLATALHGERFVIVEAGKRIFTPLFLVLILIEISDLVFAVDSIPAIFAVTKDPFIVFTANTFAILGLRAMYFLLADMAERFYLLGYGLAVIVTFVGVKMLIVDVYKIPILWMLSFVAMILVASIATSLLVPRRKPPEGNAAGAGLV